MKEITLIYLDCSEEEVCEKAYDTEHIKVKEEYVSMERDGIRKVFGLILDSQSDYIAFEESGKRSKPNRLEKMVEYLETNRNIDTALCLNEYEDAKGIVTKSRDDWMRYIKSNNRFDGSALLRLCLLQEENYYGNLQSCVFRRETYINKMFLINAFKLGHDEEKLFLMFECLFGMKVGMIDDILVTNIEKRMDILKTYEQQRIYSKLRNKILAYFKEDYEQRELPSIYKRMSDSNFERRELVKGIQKKITFFYSDRGEYFNLEPIAKEAQRRGYEVAFSDKVDAEAEIGVYCSHVGLLHNKGGIHARFSVILLHDMTQGEADWPNLWNYEPWDTFDIGILPGRQWSERWKRCSGFRYAHPRLGVYELGYPKGDYARSEELAKHVNELRETLNLKYGYSVLYAPSWEYAGKEDDFVNALQGMDVNLLVKQIKWPVTYRNIINNIEEMRKLHEGRYDHLYYIEPQENILSALAICDLVVSDESSVMTEALLFGKPSISVSDWLIPDQEPARFSIVPFDYVYKCKKADLGEKVREVMERIQNGTEEKRTDDVFSNIGMASSDIMDLIGYYIGAQEKCHCLDKEVRPIHMLHGLWD